MIGSGANMGIVPILCKEIFKGMSDAKKLNKPVEVTFSMLEIYSENVRDLLTSKNNAKNKKNSLLVRENPKTGFYGSKTFFELLIKFYFIY